MGGHRTATHEALDALFDFGRVTATKVATSTKQVLASIAGNVGASGATEARPYQVLWGHAAILFRPPVDTELLFTRRAEEMVPIASRDVRWLVELSEGDVVIRNLNGDTPTRVRLNANGEVLVETSKLGVVGAGDLMAAATKALALAEKVDSRVTSLQTAHDTHKHVMTGVGTTLVPDVFANGTAGVPFASVASDRIFSKD